MGVMGIGKSGGNEMRQNAAVAGVEVYHWLRRCTGGYMERNRVSWYCESRISVNSSELSHCAEIKKRNGEV